MSDEIKNPHDTATSLLGPFLALNPDSPLEEVKDSTKAHTLQISKPWNDPSLQLVLPDDIDSVADTLNNVYLPERYSAIYHNDSKDFEIIYTAFKLNKKMEEIKGRRFEIYFRSKNIICEFTESSERLLKIAELSRPIAESSTEYRNLHSFHRFNRVNKAEKKTPKYLANVVGDPLSFWIRDIEWDNDFVLDLVTHLNFYMVYFDRNSPRIIIHTQKKAIAYLTNPAA